MNKAALVGIFAGIAALFAARNSSNAGEWAGVPYRLPDDDGGARDSSLPRGIRNCNPGNLRANGIAWQGLSARQTDAAFCQFDDPLYGLRALARTLKTYRASHGLVTVAQIINRWAPPSQNNTGAYVEQVARELGVPPYYALSDSDDTYADLVAAITRHENGVQPYSRDLILRAVALA